MNSNDFLCNCIKATAGSPDTSAVAKILLSESRVVPVSHYSNSP